MRLIIRETKNQTSQWVAEYIVHRINEFRPTKERPFVLGLPTGSSPEKIYANLVDMYRSGKVSFKNVVTFNMDEYVGIPTSHPQSYHSFMFKHLFQHVDIPPNQIHLPSLENYHEYDSMIAKYGGIELFLCGVGSDGHIAFNEPGSSLASKTRVKTLTSDTIMANARFFDGDVNAVPKSAVTVGVKTVLDAREVILIADGRGKAEAVRQAVEGKISHSWTVTALQMHPKFIMAVDEAATEELRVKTVKYFKDIEGTAVAPGKLGSKL
ncbi:Glucosamine-6-phosphate isomerase (Glucosamine-6-phosphate deaminase) (GNPDA) (GlcN6P deaminase) [Orbilia javanica]|uniref:Glucosamine-6-phosphate isomerase n=1 Tax=Orbilia javanica TaxID=47235 RepID=A0AAN8N4I3_9PEZI